MRSARECWLYAFTYMNFKSAMSSHTFWVSTLVLCIHVAFVWFALQTKELPAVSPQLLLMQGVIVPVKTVNAVPVVQPDNPQALVPTKLMPAKAPVMPESIELSAEVKELEEIIPALPETKPQAWPEITDPSEGVVANASELPAPIDVTHREAPNNSDAVQDVPQQMLAPRIDAESANNPPPTYPRLSRRLREEGTVMLELLVLEDGSVTELIVKTSSGYPRLDKAAVKAVSKWRYVPASRGGETIAFRYQQPVQFSMR